MRFHVVLFRINAEQRGRVYTNVYVINIKDFTGNTGWRLPAPFGGRPRCAFHVCLALTKCEKYALPATKMDSRYTQPVFPVKSKVVDQLLTDY